jgi:methyl-accepting chemotaxis protein
MRKIGSGELIEEMSFKYEDEIGYIVQNLNELIRSFKRYVQFASEISNGDLNSDFKVSGVNDHLGNTLIELRNKKDKKKILK